MGDRSCKFAKFAAENWEQRPYLPRATDCHNRIHNLFFDTPCLQRMQQLLAEAHPGHGVVEPVVRTDVLAYLLV